MDKNSWWMVAISWLGTVIGHFVEQITLSRLVLFSTFVFTVLQIYILMRDKVIKHRRKHRDHDHLQ
jgi:hypothetical protein